MAIMFFIVASFSAVTYAWLADRFNSGDFEFEGGNLGSFELSIIDYPLADNTANGERYQISYDTNGDSSTQHILGSFTKCEPRKINADANGTHLEVKLENSDFGMIDNIAQLKLENYSYFKLKIPKSMGNGINIQFHYTTNDFLILYEPTYDGNGDPTGYQEVTDETILQNLQKIEDALENDQPIGTYLKYDCVVSTIDIENAKGYRTDTGSVIAKSDQTAAQGIEFKNADIKDFSVINTNSESFDGNGFYLTLNDSDFNAIEDGGYYYAYIRVMPNLEVFARSIDYISDIMPCFVYFKIGAIFETGKSQLPASPTA